jgi:hypothetical protein
MEVSTKELYAVYKLWCEDNSLHPLSERSFSAFLHENEDTYNLEATNNVYIGNGRRVRGFVGIELLQNHHPYKNEMNTSVQAYMCTGRSPRTLVRLYGYLKIYFNFWFKKEESL